MYVKRFRSCLQRYALAVRRYVPELRFYKNQVADYGQVVGKMCLYGTGIYHTPIVVLVGENVVEFFAWNF